jgi:hypothetical protein
MIRFGPVLLSLAFFGTALAAETPATVVELFGTPENIKLVREADKVDACILRHIAPTVLADGRIDRNSERYEETGFTPVPTAVAAELRNLVLSEKTFDWKADGGRRPQFYMRLRFHRGAEIIALDFCFVCHVLNVTHQSAELGHANFAPNSDLFLQAFLKVFPHDDALQQVARESGLLL